LATRHELRKDSFIGAAVKASRETPECAARLDTAIIAPCHIRTPSLRAVSPGHERPP
jgi:hypothetical protein